VDDNIKFFSEDGSYVCKECFEFNQNEIMIEPGEYQIEISTHAADIPP